MMFSKLLGIFGVKKFHKSVQTKSVRFADVGTQTTFDLITVSDAATQTSELDFGGNGTKKRRPISNKRMPTKKSKFQ